MDKIIEALSIVYNFILSYILKFPDMFGVTDALFSRILYAGFMIVCFSAGIYLASKTKKKLLGIIMDFVSLVSLISMFSGA